LVLRKPGWFCHSKFLAPWENHASLPQFAANRAASWQIASGTLLILFLAGAYVADRLHQLPPELMQDIRVGIAARDITDPNQRFENFFRRSLRRTRQSSQSAGGFSCFF